MSEISDIEIVWRGGGPISSSYFLDRFKAKYCKWIDFKIPEMDPLSQRLSGLEATWNMNCRMLNYAIQANAKGIVKKFVICAPTGSAKTQNLITYCSMLSEENTVLISTNLTDEADKIAEQINNEANELYDEIYKMAFINGKAYIPKNDYLPRAYSYHSKISKEDKLSIEDVAKFQIVVTTHSFYQNHYTGSHIWDLLGRDRDLLVIDEALETMQEYSVKDDSITRAITIFGDIQKSNKFKNNIIFMNELQSLIGELQILKNYNKGTSLISGDKTTQTLFKWLDSPTSLELKDFQYQYDYLQTYKEPYNKYQLFSEMLGQSRSNDFTLKSFMKSINFNYILTGIDDKSSNTRFKKELVDTINNLNLMNRIGQVYITSNNGHNSFHRVTDMMFTKSLVCFDATADINEIYKMRAHYYDDIHLVPRHEGVRDYSNVTLHTVVHRTSRRAVDKDLVTNVLKSIRFGSKTLVVTHKKHEHFFDQDILASYSDKTIEIAHWGAITGLNDWKDFDTCVIVGLNHKPKSYSQSRVIVNTDTEETAFGDEQDNLNNVIEYSMILSEIIQAMNRIRIRQIIDVDGNCESADIYLMLPERQEMIYKSQIKAHMPNINIIDWILSSTTVSKSVSANFTILVKYLETNLKEGDRVLKEDIIKRSKILPESFRTLMGKNLEKKQAFKENLYKCGFQIDEIIPDGKIRPLLYFRKI